jgi:hypothetical protein
MSRSLPVILRWHSHLKRNRGKGQGSCSQSTDSLFVWPESNVSLVALAAAGQEVRRPARTPAHLKRYRGLMRSILTSRIPAQRRQASKRHGNGRCASPSTSALWVNGLCVRPLMRVRQKPLQSCFEFLLLPAAKAFGSFPRLFVDDELPGAAHWPRCSAASSRASNCSQFNRFWPASISAMRRSSSASSSASWRFSSSNR